jgi:hypothetical protein
MGVRLRAGPRFNLSNYKRFRAASSDGTARHDRSRTLLVP